MVFVDSSVWIEFFKGNQKALPLNNLIDINNLCINDLILAELVPSIVQKKENYLKDLLCTITNIPLEIKWNQIIHLQTLNLQNGINRVGIPDLIIVQNVIANDLEFYSFDKHFSLMSKLHNFRLFNP
jgi:predicted nucleic acid-binding protein